jgi:hypothetical protein
MFSSTSYFMFIGLNPTFERASPTRIIVPELLNWTGTATEEANIRSDQSVSS